MKQVNKNIIFSGTAFPVLFTHFFMGNIYKKTGMLKTSQLSLSAFNENKHAIQGGEIFL
jgi:hypothetical protein